MVMIETGDYERTVSLLRDAAMEDVCGLILIGFNHEHIELQNRRPEVVSNSHVALVSKPLKSNDIVTALQKLVDNVRSEVRRRAFFFWLRDAKNAPRLRGESD